jgi:Na+/melibiose symporter-like transporter
MAKVKKIEDIVVTMLFLMFFGVVLVGIDQWIGAFRPTQTFETGPKLFPVILASLAVVLSISILIGQILKYRSAEGSDQKEEAKEETKEETITPLLKQYVLWATLLSLFIFIYAMEYVGFLVSSVFLLFALQYILGNRSLLKVALFSVGIIAVNFLIFIQLLQIQLPRGAGIFEQFSQLFY